MPARSLIRASRSLREPVGGLGASRSFGDLVINPNIESNSAIDSLPAFSTLIFSFFLPN